MVAVSVTKVTDVTNVTGCYWRYRNKRNNNPMGLLRCYVSRLFPKTSLGHGSPEVPP